MLLLCVGTLGCLNNAMSFQDLVSGSFEIGFNLAIRVVIAFALFVVLLIESSRVPADDPATHLELTMVHEVMVLDHSGPELAAVQYSAAMKMTVFAMAIAAVINPFPVGGGGVVTALSIGSSLVLLVGLAGAVGLIESLTARLRFRALPPLILAAFLAVGIALVAVVARQGGL